MRERMKSKPRPLTLYIIFFTGMLCSSQTKLIIEDTYVKG